MNDQTRLGCSQILFGLVVGLVLAGLVAMGVLDSPVGWGAIPGIAGIVGVKNVVFGLIRSGWKAAKSRPGDDS
ncbi:MAG: hypothetical protein F4Y75_02090 [Acidimicrobiia bacterium]|nr:hypothetical protein [bacterium]MXZ06296.1 hypothetical protein [Acidimicrobiia bacterium]MCY3580242.1 hypothetical protein [bacterium]MCY3653280.1 hypothetical protein [bacterium]MDE0642836.1 hypothetical protein [bacterium]